MEDGITADLKYTTLTATGTSATICGFEAILSAWQQDQRQVIDFDGTEFLVTTDDLQVRDNETMEFHLSGSALDDRISWIGGYYSLEERPQRACLRWGMWEFAVPATARVVNGVAIAPAINIAAAEYVRQTAILLGLNGVIVPGSVTPPVRWATLGWNHVDRDTTVPGAAGSAGRYPWNLTGISDDRLTEAWDEDERLVWRGDVWGHGKARSHRRRSDQRQQRWGLSYQPSDAFRTPDPSMRPQGDPFAGIVSRARRSCDADDEHVQVLGGVPRHGRPDGVC